MFVNIGGTLMLGILQPNKDIIINALLILFILGGNYFLNIDLNPYITQFKVVVEDCYI